MISRSGFFPGALRKFSWLLLLAALLVIGSVVARGETALSWKDYWRLVDETGQKVSLAEQSPTQAQALLKDVSDRWRAVVRVSLPDGKLTSVNPGLLVDQLDQVHPDWKGLHALLAQMKASQARETLVPFSAADAQAVQAILARPEYNWDADAQQNPIQRFFADLWQKFTDFLNRLIPQNGLPVDFDLRPIFTLAVSLVLLLVFYFSFQGIFRELVQEANLEEESRGEESLTAAQAMQRAQGSAENGDRRLAVRYLYLSALFLLEERGLLRYDRSQTNREYLRSIQEHPQLAVILQEMIEVFDRVWYGYRSIDRDSYAHYVEQVNRLKELK
jgi:hypothetical protein